MTNWLKGVLWGVASILVVWVAAYVGCHYKAVNQWWLFPYMVTTLSVFGFCFIFAVMHFAESQYD